MADPNIGDKIVVTNPQASFGDYVKGDTGVIEAIEEDVEEPDNTCYYVTWTSNIPNVLEESRLCMLYAEEFEVVQ